MCLRRVGRTRHALTALAPHLPAEQRQKVLVDALSAARAIGDERDRAHALTALAPHLPAEQRQKVLVDALQAVIAIGDDRDRAGALVTCAPHLPDKLRASAVHAIPEALANPRAAL